MEAKRRRYRIFYKLEEHLEIPMFLLALVWLYLFFREIFSGLTEFQNVLIYTIWFLFIGEFLLKWLLAPRRVRYIKNNWITVIALLIPALRVLRLFSAFRILSGVRFINSTKIIRALTSGKRFVSSLKEAQGPLPESEMHLGYLILTGKHENKESLCNLVTTISPGIKREMERGTGIPWHLSIARTSQLPNDNPRRPSDFLDSATLAMAEGPFDLVCVITDVPLFSRKNKIEDGLSSSVTRVIVVSTRNFEKSQMKHKMAALILHLIGHILGLKHIKGKTKQVMAPGFLEQPFTGVPQFSSTEITKLTALAKKAPDRELKNGNALESLIFHILMACRHPRDLLRPLGRNWAIFLPLSLPSLATAAVAPALILIFTAEIWDVGLGMSNGTAAFFAIISIMFASFYLVRIQNLFLPRKEKRILTEHLAVANFVIYLSIFLACIGLFFMVGILMMIVEVYVFPEDLISTWPTLNKPEVTIVDKIRLAVFISTVGVTTGALAGGLESRTLLQHLALFKYKT